MKIFISYRRDDSAGYAGRLFDHLAAHFGRRNVFMDIDTIDPGEDFRDVVHQAMGTCDVVLVLMGKQWVSTADEQGRRRLDDPRDWVRVEVASALANPKVRVVPVLVRDARMPDPEQLPEDLKELAWRNAIELSDNRFQFDANQLIGVIERAGVGRERKPRRAMLWGSLLFVAMLGLFAGIWSGLIPIPFFEPATATSIPTVALTDTAVPSPLPTASAAVGTPTTAFPLGLRTIEPGDLTMPNIWAANGIELTDMRLPGSIPYTGVVQADQEYRLHLYWCAADTTILAQNLENMQISFAVNGQAVPDEYILTYDHRPEDLDCRYAVVALSGWTPGETYVLEARRDVLRAINDGANNYPPGAYIRELTVTAQ